MSFKIQYGSTSELVEGIFREAEQFRAQTGTPPLSSFDKQRITALVDFLGKTETCGKGDARDAGDEVKNNREVYWSLVKLLDLR